MSNLNLNKYADRAAYNADTRPAGENCVSLVGQEVIYDGVNVTLKLNQLRRNDVCLVFWDTVESEYVYVPIETYKASAFDTTRYQIQNYVRFTRSMGRDVVMHKDAVNEIWAVFNRYKLQCVTSSSGGFSWSVNINGTLKSGTVSWSAGATLDSIVTQLNTGAVATYLTFTHEQGEDFIRIIKGGRTNSIFTLTNVTGGVTLTDLSESTKISGVLQERIHRDWQSQSVKKLFPGSSFPEPNSTLFARNGYNYSFRCGANLYKYKAATESRGSDTYVDESNTTKMKSAAFAALNGSGVPEQQALYDKYNGSWDAYMEASMVKIDDDHAYGCEYISYNNGDMCSRFLSSITTMDFDGTYIPSYQAAYTVAQKTDTRGVITTWGVPTMHELAVFMEDNKLSKINIAMSAINGDTLDLNSGHFCVVEFQEGYIWSYSRANGIMDSQYRYSQLVSRAIAYLD